MSKKKTKGENVNPEGLGEFETFVKGIFSLSPDEVNQVLSEEKSEGIPPDPSDENEETGEKTN